MPSVETNGTDSKKKTVHALEREREDVRLLRWHYGHEQDSLDANHLIFFDESGINLSYARLYGRGIRGHRVIGYTPKNWGNGVTLIAGIGMQGLVAPMLLHGSMNGDVFERYMTESVLPKLLHNDIIVLDNLAVHKRKSFCNRVESIGAKVLFLPPYCPELNPIELAWSKVKTLLRTDAPRTFDTLVDAVANALRAISLQDIFHWIRHCGYSINS